jgi:hypothetical protein
MIPRSDAQYERPAQLWPFPGYPWSFQLFAQTHNQALSKRDTVQLPETQVAPQVLAGLRRGRPGRLVGIFAGIPLESTRLNIEGSGGCATAVQTENGRFSLRSRHPSTELTGRDM